MIVLLAMAVILCFPKTNLPYNSGSGKECIYVYSTIAHIYCQPTQSSQLILYLSQLYAVTALIGCFAFMHVTDAMNLLSPGVLDI